MADALALVATLAAPTTTGSRSWQSMPHPSSSTPLLATASADRSVHIYSLLDFSLVSTIDGGHKRSVRCVDWKDYGRPATARSDGAGAGAPRVVLGTGSFDANVGIWMWNERRRRRRELQTDAGNEEHAIGDDQDDDNEEEEEEAGEEEWTFSTLLTGPDSEIKSIAFSPAHYSANLLATSSRDKSVWVWEEVEPEEWETIAVLGEHAGDVKCVSWCGGARGRKRRRVVGETAGGGGGGGGDVEMQGTNGHDAAGGEEEADGDESTTVLGSREILASGSYDDTIRLWRDVEEEGDWMCVAVLEGHAGTVWDVKFERHINYARFPDEPSAVARLEAEWEPRLLSCSDDLSVRVWRRELSEAEKARRQEEAARARGEATTGFVGRIPSSIRVQSSMERWVEETRLPDVHVRSVYAVDWSAETGLVVSCGGDGTIAVYREVVAEEGGGGGGGEQAADVQMNGTDGEASNYRRTKWEVVAQIDGAHDEFEINHVCWAARRDKGIRWQGEEVIVSTGDEGNVRLWEIPEGLKPRD